MSYTAYRLDDICDVITCGVAKRPDYVESGVPFLSSLNVKENKFILKTYKFISQADHLKLTKYAKPEKGDILYTRVGSFGEAAVIDLDFEFSVFVSLTLIKPKRSLVNSIYLMWYLNSPKVREFAKNNTSGIGVQNLNVGVVREYKILLPLLATQQKIAAILDAADELRQKDKALVAKYDELTQALFLDMFGAGIGENIELGKIIKLIGGGTPSKMIEEYWKGTIPWASVKDLKSDILKSTIDHITEEAVKNSATNIIPAGSLIIATRMAVGKAVICEQDTAINQDLKAVKIIGDANVKFLQHFFKSKETYFDSISSGATVKGIKIEHITKLKVPIPPIKLQNQFAERVKAIEEQKNIAQASALKSEELFNSLLQKAFNGELV